MAATKLERWSLGTVPFGVACSSMKVEERRGGEGGGGGREEHVEVNVHNGAQVLPNAL